MWVLRSNTITSPRATHRYLGLSTEEHRALRKEDENSTMIPCDLFPNESESEEDVDELNQDTTLNGLTRKEISHVWK